MRKIIYLILCLPLLLSACKDGTEVENPSSERITLLGNIGSIGVETRGEGVITDTYTGALLANFARVNQTGVTAEAVPTFPLYTEAAAIAPLVANRAANSNVFNFTATQSYPTDATYKNTKMVGWYPATTAAINPSSYAAGVVTFTLDGSTDVMLTNEVTGSSDANNKFSDAGHSFTFAHQLTQLQFKVYAEDAAAATAWGTITSISVMNQKPTCTIALPSGVTFSGTAPVNGVAASNVSTAALPITSGTAAVSGYVMIPPLTTVAAGQTVTLRIVTSKAIADVTLDASAGLLQSKAYAYTLKFTRTGIAAAAGQVANWITGISNNYEVDASTQTVNLSAAETANSYIAKPGGTYKFNATVMGNGVARGSDAALAPTALTPTSVSVLWQTSAGLISGTPTLSNGYVTFSTKAATEGNAVIAVRDATGIVWSWHIWVANYNPNATAYSYNNGTATNVFMDRNLGATTTTPTAATTLGLLYQWGRKDPFPGYASLTANTEPTLFGEQTSITKTAVSVASNLANSIAHPEIYYTGSDWYQTGGTKNDNLWGTSKTIYDPCPPGWHVPAFSGSTSPWSGLTAATGGTWSNGYTWSSNYYPASGYREVSGGILTGLGSGLYWSASVTTGANAYSMKFTGGNVNPSDNFLRGHGFAVRCVKVLP